MKDYEWSILVGVTDYDEGADLSTHLISYGWNVDHCYSAAAVMDTLFEGEYDLVVFDDELLTDSEWTLEEIADSLPGETRAIIIGEAGAVYPFENFEDRIRVLIRPFSYNLLHSQVEMLLSDLKPASQPGEEEEDWVDEDDMWEMSIDDLTEYVTV